MAKERNFSALTQNTELAREVQFGPQRFEKTMAPGSNLPEAQHTEKVMKPSARSPGLASERSLATGGSALVAATADPELNAPRSAVRARELIWLHGLAATPCPPGSQWTTSPRPNRLASFALLREPREEYQLSVDGLARAVATDDFDGARMAWVGAVDAVMCGGAPLGQLRGLLRQLDRMEPPQRDDPPPADWVHTLVSARALAAIGVAEPGRPDLSGWRDLVESRWRQAPHLDAGVQAACFLVWDLSRLGRLVHAGTLVRRIELQIYGKSIAPTTQLCLCWARATYAAHAGALDRALREVNDAETAARGAGVCHLETAVRGAGVRHLEVPLAIESLRARLAAGQVEEAARECRRLLNTPDMPPAFEGCLDNLAAQAEGRRGLVMPALEHVRAAVDLLADGPVIDRALAHVGAAQLHLSMEDRSAAAAELATARRAARGLGCTWLDSLVALTSAECAFACEKPRRGAHLLRQALATARKHGLLHPPIWSPHLFANTCRRALELKIEEQFVSAMIRANGLMPRARPLEVKSWPWPVRVLTLGRFALEVNGQPVVPKGRGDSKPLLLIKLLVSNGEAETDANAIVDLLWPDVEGDAQSANLRSVLHRARRLLGDGRAIAAEHGALRLAADRVWTDAGACDHCLARAEAFLHEDNGLPAAAGLCERALQLYRGPFLPSLANVAWAHRMRARLQDRLVTTSCDVALRLARCGYTTRAARMARRVLDQSPTAETAYCILLRVFAQRGQWAQAMETYARCKSALAPLGTSPGPEIQAEHDRVRERVSFGGRFRPGG